MKTMMKWKVVSATLIVFTIFVGCRFISSALGATETPIPTPFTITINPDDAVELAFEPGIRNIEHGINNLVSGFGFKVWVSGLDVNSVLIFDMIGPKGEYIRITPTLQRESIKVFDADISFTIPYDAEGLYPGLWFVSITEPEKLPATKIEIPKVTCFNDNYDDCILDFSDSERLVP